jgi:hypothetical protein
VCDLLADCPGAADLPVNALLRQPLVEATSDAACALSRTANNCRRSFCEILTSPLSMRITLDSEHFMVSRLLVAPEELRR